MQISRSEDFWVIVRDGSRETPPQRGRSSREAHLPIPYSIFSAISYNSFSESSQPRQGSVMDLP